MDVKNDILWRVYLSYLLVVVVALAVLGKAVYIQQVQGVYWKSLSDSLHQKMDEIEAERGTIFSEDGQMLSTSVPRFDIYWDTRLATLRNNNGQLFREKIDSVCEAMAGLFKDITAGEYKVLMQQAFQKQEGFCLLKKKISFREYEQLREFPLFNLGRYTSGMIAVQKNFRLNPYQMLAFRTIGLVRDSNQVGLENSYDTVLQGKAGKQLVRYISGGVKIPVEDDQYVVEPETGKDIVSTLDVFIQGVTEKALMNAMVKHEAEQGSAMVMETATGKIKAIANLGKMDDGTYWEKFNYAISLSEPGSTFKLATLLALLEDKKVSLHDIVDVEGGVWKLNNQTVYDAEVHGIREETVQQAFEKSSNVGMAKLVWTNYGTQPSKYLHWLSKMHLDTPMGIDLAGEGYPEVHRPGQKIWNPTTVAWMAFGYNLQITPLQTLCLYNAIANGGKMMKPYLVSAISKEGKIIRTIQPTVLREQLCSSATLQQLNKCLQGVCLRGTAAQVFKNTPYQVAGKTGTAQVADRNQGYNTNIYQASFAGFFPADHPKYTCVVVIKNKAGAILHHGSDVAAPVFKEIADRLYSTYLRKSPATLLVNNAPADSIQWQLAGNKNDLQMVAQALHIPVTDSSRAYDQWGDISGTLQKGILRARVQSPQIMPSLRGLGLKDALLLGESNGLQMKVSGKGKVISQSITAGDPIQKKQVVQIQLSEHTNPDR